jgi:hypothetical protein
MSIAAGSVGIHAVTMALIVAICRPEALAASPRGAGLGLVAQRAIIRATR